MPWIAQTFTYLFHSLLAFSDYMIGENIWYIIRDRETQAEMVLIWLIDFYVCSPVVHLQTAGQQRDSALKQARKWRGSRVDQPFLLPAPPIHLLVSKHSVCCCPQAGHEGFGFLCGWPSKRCSVGDCFWIWKFYIATLTSSFQEASFPGMSLIPF